ncbi:MAG: 2-hydroxyacid dehydrogenase [Bacteroidetes bacterium]|nr:MAG: 2-hydroxyacid dehydrogenase [Bacteroidota bacterium]
MNVAVFSSHAFELPFLERANQGRHTLRLLEPRLSEQTAMLARDCQAVSIFVTDRASRATLEILHQQGVQYLTLRSAGFNHVDLEAARALGFRMARVPAYSPYSIAEHTVALMLALNRKLVRAHNRVRELNFSLNGLMGFDMHGKTVGVIGTGKIGAAVVRILHGFGCRILAQDLYEDPGLKADCQVTYTDCDTLCRESDIITLHVPLTPETHYLINQQRIANMKQGVMLINTSRGALVNTAAVIAGLKSRKIGYFGMDVYEEEEGLFFEDHSEDILMDDKIARLMTFNNVLITSHQAFLTDTALTNIAETTVYNLDCFEKGVECENEILI